MNSKSLSSELENIASAIHTIRGQKVILDADLAAIYGVPTKRLNEQVKRNKNRFPPDFMFQLIAREKKEVVAICDHLQPLKYSAALPYAFTEHGAIMAANVLNSARAVQMSVFVVRAFVRLKGVLAAHKELADQLAKLERRVGTHDEHIQAIFEAIHQLMNPPEPPRRQIGFHAQARPQEIKAIHWKKAPRPVRLKSDPKNKRANGPDSALRDWGCNTV